MLNTNIKSLEKRGYVDKKHLDKFKHLNEKELLQLLYSDCAKLRSTGAYLLKPNSREALSNLIICLTKEKSLYTKIAICQTLQKGSLYAAKKMIEYLGSIGNNHHKTPAKKVSAKKSYPLPRDIIARTLSKMDIKIYPALMKTLLSKDKIKISEVLDAIGYMTFYNEELDTKENAKIIIDTAKKYKTNTLILWKTLTCLSSFSCEESERFLIQFSKGNSIINLEAKRSISIIKKRKNNKALA